jgi:hypothetical protein
MKGRALPRRGIARKPPTSLARAISAAAAMSPPAAPSPVPPGPPQAIAGPSQPLPAPSPEGPPNMNAPPGATDGLGAGQGGLAIHPTLKQAKIAAYEPRHSSKHR